jgi:hypothetical protein
MGYSGHRVTMSCSDDREVPAVDVFDREGPWTEEAYLALPADGRVELVDGTLLVGPATTPARQRAVQAVRDALAAALPEGLQVVGPVPIRLGPDCVLVPDLLVTRAEQDEPEPEAEQDTEGAKEPDDAPAAEESEPEATKADAAEEPEPEPSEPRILEAADALLVAEFVGREHGAADRTFKPQIYARSRIPYSLLIDYDSPFALASMIIGGRYHEYAYAEGAERFWLDEPFRLEMDLTSLTAEKAQETVAQEAVAQENVAQEKAEKKAVPAP